jgi:RNA polymerase sigma-70 factor (ECF subfamily)
MSAAEFPFPVSTVAAATDALLVESLRACARRSVPALQRIYDQTAPQLLGELVQRLGDRQAAETALEDCFVQIWQQAGSFNPERCRPGTWLLSIARQHAIDLREQQPEPPEEVDATLRLADAALGEQASVKPELRILRLAYASGRSTAEIARALGLPVRRIRESIRHALRSLEEVAGP